MRRTSDVAIARVRPAADAEWDAAWLASDHATWFHSRAWAEIWAEYRRGELLPAARVVELSDGRSALLPFSEGRARGSRIVHLVFPTAPPTRTCSRPAFSTRGSTG